MRCSIQSSSRLIAVSFVALLFLAFVSNLYAVHVLPDYSLHLQQQAPDVRSTGITVTYDAVSATTGNLVIEGKAMELDVDGTPPPIDYYIFQNYSLAQMGAAYTINIGIEVAETIEATSGTLEIQGYLGDNRDGNPPPELIAGTGTLLTGNVTDFGFTDLGIFEFLFESTGGDLADSTYAADLSPIFGPVGSSVGVILNPKWHTSTESFADFFVPLGLSAFTADFSNLAEAGESDTFVPEPSTLIGLISLLFASILSVRRLGQAA